MTSCSKLVGLVLSAAATGVVSLPARALTPVNRFAFGDSYTTTAFSTTGPQPAYGNPLGNPAYGQGTYAGGPNYVGLLTTKYNSTFVANYDFAVGGATISDSIVTYQGIPASNEQVGQRFEPQSTQPHVNAWSSDNTIFSVFFGINDIGITMETAQYSNATRIDDLLNAYFQTVDNMYNQGARRFMFVGVPPMERSPFVQGNYDPTTQQQWGNLCNIFNGNLAQRVKLWQASRPESYAAIYDFHRYATLVLHNPTAYGFLNAECIDTGGQACIWWNDYHVGSRFHDLLAQRMLPAMNSLEFNSWAPTAGVGYFY
ncbi:Acetylesterase [Fulvia fulva]|uniref:Acetylesterase n=1 Tax=Passalora fulva TaxID=5499 RepID=A0A9Q8PGF7_PASFU|nr:Acetylesterase [Fulvia fulva]KAK4613597.1 Acetylesterase [Fulvia fulva]KAK4615250.1 Acetylesterase [Fulvia fulva]UJO22018.1 Acetylesterase [Fulvia fulva]WPV19858.1 Acetylesterase [Fulvia fulva]WPV35185.1 Acetylesterase [Fulvia fulva]